MTTGPRRDDPLDPSADPRQMLGNIVRVELVHREYERHVAFADMSADGTLLLAVLAVLYRRAMFADVSERFLEPKRLIAAMEELRAQGLMATSWAASENSETVELVLVLSDDVEIPDVLAAGGE